jgi:uncharacterized membrane protein
METTTESDNQKKKFLFNLAKVCLQKLNVNFTASFLKETIDKTYALTFETEYTDENNRNRITVADKEDASNLAIVLLEAFKRYHIKNEVSDVHSGQTTLLVLSSPDKDHDYRHLLAVQSNDDDDHTDSPKKIENRVVLKTTGFTGEPVYILNRNKERLRFVSILLLIALLTTTLGMAIYQGWENYPLPLWIPVLSLLLMGCFVCYHLYKLEKTNTYVSKFFKKMCSAKQNDSDCKEVISSSASKLAGLISHTDMGIVYFSSMLAIVIIALMSNTYDHYLSFLFWVAALPLPYTLFSVYYQLRIIKKICVMCMMIQAILWMQFACFLFLSPRINITDLHFEVIIYAALILSAVSTLYFLYMENRRTTAREKADTLEIFKFKSSNLFFEDAMLGQLKFIQDDFPVTFSLGDPSANEKIACVLSLFCAPCGDKLNELLKLADWFEEQIDIQIIIKPDAPAAALIKELIMHANKGELKKVIHILSHWYSFFQQEKQRGNVNASAIVTKWNAYYPAATATEQVESQYAWHRRFYENYPMPFTPLMQYNGKLLPGMYQDLELLSNRIEQRIEQEQNYEYA